MHPGATVRTNELSGVSRPPRADTCEQGHDNENRTLEREFLNLVEETLHRIANQDAERYVDADPHHGGRGHGEDERPARRAYGHEGRVDA
jgi:hypothetical protein